MPKIDLAAIGKLPPEERDETIEEIAASMVRNGGTEDDLIVLERLVEEIRAYTHPH